MKNITEIPTAVKCIYYWCYGYECSFYDDCFKEHLIASTICNKCLKKGREAIPLSEIIEKSGIRYQKSAHPPSNCLYHCEYKK